MNEYFIAWWNVENLFDVENSIHRPDWLAKKLKKELIGWNEDVLAKKINQLSKIILKMNKNTGPDILGVCEIENHSVMRKLVDSLNIPNRNYKILHEEMEDNRGIDIAFIYDAKRFNSAEKFSHVILQRNATRDILQINFKLRSSNKDLILIGNHWTARNQGTLESEPYRIIAAETLSYWNERIIEKKGKQVPIVTMGDFNDDPYSRSITQYALGTSSKMKVIKSLKKPRLFNAIWSFLGKSIGTYYFNGVPFLFDQFMLSKGIIQKDSSIKLKSDSVNIIRFPEMIKGIYKIPVRFGRPNSTNFNPNGFSDHFPISLILEEEF